MFVNNSNENRYITGLHGIEEAVKQSRNNGRIFVSKKNKRIENILQAALNSNFTIINLSTEEMDTRFGDKNRGLVLQLYNSSLKDNKKQEKKLAAEGFEKAIKLLQKKDALVVILDEVTDPHNFGAILRSAEQMGADMVVSRSRRSASESDTVSRTSAGAVNYVSSFVVNNLARAVEYLKKNDFWVYSAEMNGSPAYEVDLSGRVAIILGSEGRGVSRLLSEKSDGAISVPSFGKLDSLNVSVAAGILMYEVRRQRLEK